MTGSWLDLMVTPKGKAKDKAAEEQREHDKVAVAAMRAKLASERSHLKKKKGSVKASPVRPVHASRCAEKDEVIRTWSRQTGFVDYVSKGHKCPDL